MSRIKKEVNTTELNYLKKACLGHFKANTQGDCMILPRAGLQVILSEGDDYITSVKQRRTYDSLKVLLSESVHCRLGFDMTEVRILNEIAENILNSYDGVELKAEEEVNTTELNYLNPKLDSLKNNLIAFLKRCEDEEAPMVRHTFTRRSTLAELCEEVEILQLNLTLEQAQIIKDIGGYLAIAHLKKTKKFKIYVRMAKSILEILWLVEAALKGESDEDNNPVEVLRGFAEDMCEGTDLEVDHEAFDEAAAVTGMVDTTFDEPAIVEAMRENDPLGMVKLGDDIHIMPLLVKSEDTDFEGFIKLALDGKRSGNYVFSRADLEHIDSMIKGADTDYQSIADMEHAAELASERLTQRADVLDKIKLHVSSLESDLNQYKSKFNGASSACTAYRQELEQKDTLLCLGVTNINKVRETLEGAIKQNEEFEKVVNSQGLRIHGLNVQVDKYDDMYNTLVSKAEQLQATIDILQNQNRRLTNEHKEPLGNYTYERGVADKLVLETFEGIPISVIERMHDKNNGRYVESLEIHVDPASEPDKSAEAMMVDTSLLSEEEKETLVDAIKTIMNNEHKGVIKMSPGGYLGEALNIPDDFIDPDAVLVAGQTNAIGSNEEKCPVEMDEDNYLG